MTTPGTWKIAFKYVFSFQSYIFVKMQTFVNGRSLQWVLKPVFVMQTSTATL